ncbi:MAG: phospho-N-acetylmuramoyl-pentapeptide-transferase [Parcubacteria bacterium C7867-005]|nr:MAG: phospho-N-acetylmuramoyl-pentapeptide-transferase [Parcubacteria bacterium C7867-005]
MIIDVVKIFTPPIIAFGLGMFFAPILTDYLYKNKMWKKKSGKHVGIGGGGTPVFNELHKEKEVGTPRMGGIVIWASVLVTVLGTWILSHIFPDSLTLSKLDLLSRNQTWIPLFTLIFGALVGLVDDILEIKGGGDNAAGGLSLSKRLIIITTIGLAAALWFYFKLDVHIIGLPQSWGVLDLGVFFIPFFVLVMLALYSGGVIDGIDGLAGGTFATMFAAYAGIAFYQQQINLAAFCAVVLGGILAFLWYNIPPARFYMSETGSMGLTITLAVVAFMTDSIGGGYGVLVLPIIALPLLVTTLSNIIQVLSKKMRGGKKVFLIAPLHHHFEAIGWPAYKVTMRYWIISVIFAMLGLVLALLD